MLDSIANFKERIIPVFAALEERKRQIEELEHQRAELHHRNEQRLRSQRIEIDELKNSKLKLSAEKRHADNLVVEAVASAENATSEVLTLREQNQKLLDERAMVLKNLANEKEKDEELRRYKGFCDDYKKQVRLVVYVVVVLMM